MNTPCPVDTQTLRFTGTPAQQARCLLRKVLPQGNVADTAPLLPASLRALVGTPMDIATAKVAAWLQKKGIAPSEIGGPLDAPLSRTKATSAAPATTAMYFVIHDTSTLLREGKFTAAQAVFPPSVNTAAWSGNDLSKANGMQTHVFINRLGKSANSNDYGTPLFATKRERNNKAALLGLFIHHELAMPRLNNMAGVDEYSPDPGLTAAQYERLAVCYVAAAARAGSWLIPAFHGVIDLGIKDGHDDPQHFDLEAWVTALDTVRAEMVADSSGSGTPFVVPLPVPPAVSSVATLSYPGFKGDSLLEAIIEGHAEVGKNAQQLAGVAKLQQGLNLLSASHPEYAINLGANGKNSGFYGPMTESAVYEFQTDQGLPKTGVVNAATLAAIDSALSHLGSGAPSPEQPTGGSPQGAPGPDPSATPIPPVGLWTTAKGFSQDKDDPAKGWAKTTGISGSSQRYTDGTVVMEGSETLDARRRSTQLPTITAKQKRFIKDGVHYIEQTGYCRNGRVLPPALFMEHHKTIVGEPDVIAGYSTKFGKSDDMDEGTGSEEFGTTQTSSEVCGCSVKRSILVEWFGENYAEHPDLLKSFVEVYFPGTKRYAKVPLTDVGPSERVKAKIDLTEAVDQFLGTEGGDDVYFRLVRPVV